MATVNYIGLTASTNNTNSYASSSFTPTNGDLLVVYVVSTATVAAAPTLSGSTGTTFALVAQAVCNTSADTMYLYIANSLSTNTSQTVTWDCTGDNATGCAILYCGVSGMSWTGSRASRQTCKAENQATGTPAPVFASAPLTTNPLIGCITNQSSGPMATEPSGWTEHADTSYINPRTGFELCSINSGFTSTTVTYGGSSNSSFAVMVVELDTSTATTTNAGWPGTPGGWW